MTEIQQRIVELRSRILSDRSTPQIQVFLKKHQKELIDLGKLLQQWMDESAIHYKRNGMRMVEWIEDVTEWLKLQHFHIVPAVEGQNKSPVYLNADGIGSLIAFSFILQ